MLLRRVHAIAAVLFVVSIVVQVFLAGLAIANLGGSGDFASHIEFGYTAVGLSVAALLITAIIARRPRRDVATALGLLVLYVVQTALPGLKSAATWIAALHPVNAMLLFGLASWYAWRTWRVAFGTDGTEAEAAPQTAPSTAR